MSALDTLLRICNQQTLMQYDFRYCLVDANKHPFTMAETFAKPNEKTDFVSIDEVVEKAYEKLPKYEGLGVSVQASNVCAIDIDHCVGKKFDKATLSDLAKEIVDAFKAFAYIEFSFSGTGLRIFFKANKVEEYEQHFYVKNSTLGIEFYYPEGSARYVTITGRALYANEIKELNEEEQSIFHRFLMKYMQRAIHTNAYKNETFFDDRSIDELMKKVRTLYLTDSIFQELWFGQAPGSGHDESERDYHLVACLYESITKDKDKIKVLFERSPFFKSKDWKHMTKWQKQDCRYFNYLYSKRVEKS